MNAREWVKYLQYIDADTLIDADPLPCHKLTFVAICMKPRMEASVHRFRFP